ncbi:PqqD family peptide modification chaperone [Pseudomaricurvus alcaniphilus]|uniref:PqqD family peptide modification chaperone n=1 Tax=Pseudomaricurvus alcaniphilus TaxID=1166482 RepID=UPI00140B0EF1|nr:PqqD family peptide modification chaperone [Pseudomaricurvus alcaniphilus]NHN39031.1 PqqD family peptide modification chaperone [Pseudomaricurvus alcaniphilus]
MATNLKSNSWYRVCELRPALREHTEIHRQAFRGKRWYVIQDRASGKHHRFTPAAYLVISLMDGQRTVEKIWTMACEELGDDNLTQDEVIKLLAQLHHSDLLKADRSPDLRDIAMRAEKQARRKLLQRFINPLAVRLPLFDPDRFLNLTLPLVRPLFSWVGLLLFVCVAVTGVLLALAHWSELTANVGDRILAAESLLLLFLTYPFIKALHELGHGYAVKIRGGEVHEIGLMFLVFIPVPYVDASASSAFPSKWHRALVGSAGMLVEVFLAFLALFVWLNIEPGLARAFAFNIMVIGGVSTLLFNGNPLLRFDGYFVLSDLIEIPNLATRANRYLGYLIQRYLFGVEEAVSPVTARGEAGWFLFYSIASFCYRIFITTTIILFISSEYFVVGVVLGIWAGLMIFVWPLLKMIGFLLHSPVLREQRPQALMVTGAVGTVLTLLLTLVPVPFATVTEGVVWGEPETVLHVNADGIVEKLLVEPNALVAAGTPILKMTDPLLPARVRVLRAELHELQTRYAALQVVDRAEARVVAEQIKHAEAELAINVQREQEMVVLSPASGHVLLRMPRDLEGKFFRKGESLGYVTNLEDPIVRVLVPQSAIDLVREQTLDIRVRPADCFSAVRSASVLHELPFVTQQLPSAAFSTQGGGQIAVDPTDPSGMTALEMLYQLELKVANSTTAGGVGSRVYVRFSHGSESLAYQAYRRIRQLFLSRFSV